MVKVRGENFLPSTRAEPGLVLRGQKDGSAAAAMLPWPRRAPGRAWQSLLRRTLSTWARTCTLPDPANAPPAKANADKRREWRAKCASYCGRFLRHACCLSLCLMKNTHNLRLKFRKFKGEYKPPGMQDEIESRGQHVSMAPQCLAHPPLDAVAFMRLTEYFSRSKSHTRPDRQWRPGVCGSLPGQKPAHGRGLPLAASGIRALIIGVPLQALSG